MENTAKDIKTNDAQVKVRKGSSSLTIKAFNGSIKNLKDLKMVNKEETEQLEKLQKTIFERWAAIQMKL